MDKIMDLLDDYIFGPLNLIDRGMWLFWAIWYRDIGHRIKFIRADKYIGDDVPLSGVEVFDLLKKYGIDCYGSLHDANYITVSVKRSQANFAEYTLLRHMPAGQLVSATKNRSNNNRTAGNRRGTPMPAWRDRR